MNNMTQAAIEWLDRGVAPIPVVYQSKVPAVEWRMWKDRLPPKKVVDFWFKDDHTNLGVICGGPSNLAIIDFDNLDYYYDWRRDMVKRNDNWKRVATKTYRVRTPRGMHLYLRTARPEHSRKYPDTCVDVRCSGNYTLVPPSIHPSGNKYEAIGKPEDLMAVDSLQEIFPDFVTKVTEQAAKDVDIFSIGGRVTIDELKSRVSILTFVGQMAQLKRVSPDGRWWWSRCIHPSHKDKHPSFQIDAVKNRAKCMSSQCKLYHNIGLDVIDLYRIIHGCSSVGAAIREMEMIYG